jgi:hypothetical protein
VLVAASDRRLTIQVISTNYTCLRLSPVSLGFSLGLRGAAPAADETTPTTAAQCRGRRGTEGGDTILVVFFGLYMAMAISSE